MQKKLLAVAVAGALGAPAFALAQNATVNVYGRIYLEYGKVYQGNTAGGLPLVDVDMMQTPGSNIGFRGEEKLGGNMSAWFQCESTADVRGQSQDGFCGRNSAIGLKGGFGNVFMGVWDTPFKRVQDATGSNDTGLFGSAFVLMNNSTTVGSGAASQAVFKRRQQNSFNYETPSWGGFQLMGTWTNLNTQTATLDSATGSKPRLWSLAAQYKNGPLNVYGAYETHKDVVAGTNQDDKGWLLGATYTFANSIKLGGLYSQQKWETGPVTEGKVNTWHIGVDWKISGPHGLRAAVSSANDIKGNSVTAVGQRPAAINGGVTGSTGARLWQIRYVHTLSKRTELTLGYVRLNNDSNARYQLGGLSANGAGQDQHAFAFGIDHRF